MVAFSVLFVWCVFVVCFVATTVIDGKKKDDNLPSCDSTRKNYKSGKLYDVLGVKKSATKKEIRKAFKKMCVKCHPDKDRENEHADDNFIAISGAYETLGDENERKKYDAGPSPFDSTYNAGNSGDNGRRTRGGGRGQHQYTFHQGGGTQHQWKPKDFKDINVENIFQSFFGGKKSGSGSFQFGTRGSEAGDSEFESLFQNFHFGNRRHGHGSGSLFDGFAGMFQGPTAHSSGTHFGTRTRTTQTKNKSKKRSTKAPSASHSKASAKSKKPSSSKTTSKKSRTTTTTKPKRSTSSNRQPPPPPSNTKSSKVRERMKIKQRAKAGKASGERRCRYSVRDGEICD
eukprot:m.106637 g.106637  ORF g.106637 m.106637 type:complete len:343 (+) comp12677_c0_seq2:150-1178(+)